MAHISFAEPFCPVLRQALFDGAQEVGAPVHRNGTLVVMEGPAFSTRAESALYRSWGADLIGMTALPEAKLAREAEMCYATIALPTDYDCWRPHDPTIDKRALLSEIVHNLEEATANCVQLLRATLRSMAGKPISECSCHSALDAAIWSDRKAVPKATRERLGILIAKYITHG